MTQSTNSTRYAVLLAAATAITLLWSLCWAPAAPAQTLGMMVDRATSRVIVFDADTDQPMGSIQIPVGRDNSLFDCTIVGEQNLAFVSDYYGKAVWVIDLTTMDLDGGLNPIPISIGPLDMTVTADLQYLVSSGGGRSNAVSVVDLEDRFETSTLENMRIHSVEACTDGTILATSFIDDELTRLQINQTGQLSANESLDCENAFNTVCSPASGAGVLVDAYASDFVVGVSSSTTETNKTTAANSPVSAVMSPTGGAFYVRSTGSGGGVVEKHAFDDDTGVVGALPDYEAAASEASVFYGVEQLAIHPNSRKLYVPEGDKLRVIDAASGQSLGNIQTPSLQDATGVCFAVNPSTFIWDLAPCEYPNSYTCNNPTGLVSALIYGSPMVNAGQIDLSTVRLALASDPTQTIEPARVFPPSDWGQPADVDSASCDYGEYGTPDGVDDIAVKFRAADLSALIGCGPIVGTPELILIGSQFDGSPVVAGNTQMSIRQ